MTARFSRSARICFSIAFGTSFGGVMFLISNYGPPTQVEEKNVALMYYGNAVHGRHNREFTLEEVVHLLRGAVYEVDRAETH